MSFPALPVITDALTVSGFAMFGEAPEPEASKLAARLINDILLEWSVKSIYNPYVYTERFSSNGTNDYLLGTVTGGDTPDAATNPAAISSLVLQSGTVTWPIQVLSIVDWESVMPKNITGITSAAFFDFQSPQSELKLWPIAPAGYTIALTGMKLIPTIENAHGTVQLPVWYQEFLKWTLAQRLVPMMPPDVNANPKTFEYIERAMNTAGSAIKRRNSKLRTHKFASDLPSVGSGSNINDGYLLWPGRAI